MIGPEPFRYLAVACRRCGAPTSVWSKVDDTEPILVCVTHGGARDCPGKQPLPPEIAALWRRLHPDAGPVERARLRQLLIDSGMTPAQLDRVARAGRGRPIADDDDADPPDDDALSDDETPRQLTLFW